MSRGRKVGELTPGSLMHQLSRLDVGERLWTERLDRSVSGSAARQGLKVTTTRFAAVNSQTLETIRVYRITRA